MSILVRFPSSAMTAQEYDEVSAQIREKLDWPPEGMEFHVCFGPDDDLRVSEVWSSMEQFEAFGRRLMPVLAEGGIEFSAPPEIIPVHNVEEKR